MTSRILHIFENYAFLHLADIFFFNYSHQVLESVIDFVGIELVTLPHALTEEVVTALFGED